MRKIILALAFIFAVACAFTACNKASDSNPSSDNADCEHVWETITIKPTCTYEGYDLNTCIICQDSVQANKTNKLNHDCTIAYTIGGNYHWYECNNCDFVGNKEHHSLGSAGLCTVCEFPLSSTPDIFYEISEDSAYAIVIGYNGTYDMIKIAEEYEGVPVKTIYDAAFFNNDTITYVAIPDSVINISDWTFSNCTGLTSITITDNVTYIGSYAFYGCTKLTDVYYTGNEEEWAKITIGYENLHLTNATIHYNYVPEE